MVLIGREDAYGGVTVKTDTLDEFVKKDFENHLESSIQTWKESRKKGIWFRVHINDSSLVPILARHSFVFHHAMADFVMMNRWLPRSLPNTLPKFAHTQIGVGGMVVDKDGRVLLMREKKGSYLGWKFPGGLADPGENIYETARREVEEETGVAAVADVILLFRQMSVSQWRGVGDIYFVCAMRLEDEGKSKITACPHETEEARWFTRDELCALDSTLFHSFHHSVLEQYDKWIGSGRKGCHRIDSDHLRGFKVDMFIVD